MGQVRRQPNRRAHCDQVKGEKARWVRGGVSRTVVPIATKLKGKKHDGSGEASAEPSCPLRPS